MNEEAVTVHLKEIPRILQRHYEKLKEFKDRLDMLLQTIKQISDREKEFHFTLNYVRKVSNALQLYLHGTEHDYQVSILRELESIDNDISDRLTRLRVELNSRKVVDEDLERYIKQYRDDILSFIEQKRRLLTNILESCRTLFEEYKKKVQDEFNVLKRLTNTLKRGIPQDRTTLIENLGKHFEKAEQVITDFPENITELVNRFEKKKDSIKGLYARTSKTLSQVRETIRKLAIENELLSEREIDFLETLSTVKDKEIELGELMELLEKELNFDSELVKKMLLTLSEKGFIVLKVVV